MLYQTQNPHGGDVYTHPNVLDFSANINPFGTPQCVLDAIAGALGSVCQYPDPYCRKLTEALSQFEQVPDKYILCGNGAAELIYSFCEAARPRKAVEVAPTFSEYALALRRVGCQPVRYFLRKENDFALTEDFLSFLRAESPDAVFLCSPNNPTGRTVAPDLMAELARYCADAHARLFVDECFLDFVAHGQSAKRFLRENPAVFILKAFTKNYGMAGVRLGYCLCADTALLEAMSRAMQPWNVSTLAQVAGVAALGERAFLEKTRETVQRERQWLKAALESLGLYVCPSEANFLLFRAGEGLRELMLAHGVSIRDCSHEAGLSAGWYRVAVRLHDENEALLAALRRVCGKE